MVDQAKMGVSHHLYFAAVETFAFVTALVTVAVFPAAPDHADQGIKSRVAQSKPVRNIIQYAGVSASYPVKKKASGQFCFQITARILCLFLHPSAAGIVGNALHVSKAYVFYAQNSSHPGQFVKYLLL